MFLIWLSSKETHRLWHNPSIKVHFNQTPSLSQGHWRDPSLMRCHFTSQQRHQSTTQEGDAHTSCPACPRNINTWNQSRACPAAASESRGGGRTAKGTRSIVPMHRPINTHTTPGTGGQDLAHLFSAGSGTREGASTARPGRPQTGDVGHAALCPLWRCWCHTQEAFQLQQLA